MAGLKPTLLELGTSGGTPQAPESARDVIRRVIEAQARAWETGDAAGIAAAFADPCEFIVSPVRFTSPGQILRVAAEHFRRFTDIRVDLKTLVIERTTAAVEWRWCQR